jgi:chromosome segregation ATPase
MTCPVTNQINQHMNERDNELARENETLRDRCDELERVATDLVREKEESEAKRKETAKDFEVAFRVVRQENASLQSTVDALRNERDESIQEREGRIKYLSKQLDDWEQSNAKLIEALTVSRNIGNTFWTALKPLNLQAINVANPGSHVSQLIFERDVLRKERDDYSAKAFAFAESSDTLARQVEELKSELAEAKNGVCELEVSLLRSDKALAASRDQCAKLSLEVHTLQDERDNALAILRAIVGEIDGPKRSFSDDSYLPDKFLVPARAALTSTPQASP